MTADPSFAMVTLCYLANGALGTAVAARLVDTRGFRWLHHALYIATCTAGVVAVAAGWRGPNRRAALVLLPAAVPLAALPWAGSRTARHPLVALAAAPFIAASLICSMRPDERR